MNQSKLERLFNEVEAAVKEREGIETFADAEKAVRAHHAEFLARILAARSPRHILELTREATVKGIAVAMHSLAAIDSDLLSQVP